MKLTSKTLLTGLTTTLGVVFGLATAGWAGGGDGDSPYNMPRSFYGGGGEGDGAGDDGSGNGETSSDSGQQNAVLAPSRENSRGPKSTDTEATTATAEKKKELNKKFNTIPVTVLPGGSFTLATTLDAHSATLDVSGAKLKAPGQTQSVFGAVANPAAGALALTVASESNAVAKHLALGFHAQGTFALNAGNAQVKLRPAASTPTVFATVALGTVASDGSFHAESMTVVTVHASGFDLSALVAQWSNVASAAGKTVQVEIAASGVSPVATARFAAGVAKPTLYVSTEP